MARERRTRIVAIAALGTIASIAAIASGCGGKFTLPTEVHGARVIPSDGSYQMIATWTGMDGIQDILLTQGTGSQLFLLFNTGGSGLGTRGHVALYSRTAKTGAPAPFGPDAFAPLSSLFNPVAICAGTAPALSPPRRLYVLDQGDTLLARSDPATGAHDPKSRIFDLSAYWRVREFHLLGGDTVSTFTDTSLAFVRGVAADEQGLVYVAGIAIAFLPNPFDPRLAERVFRPVIYRYARGPRYPGVDPPDHNMPGAAWHRDTTWSVEGSPGIGTVGDVGQIDWASYAGGWIYSTDPTQGQLQQLSPLLSNTRGFIVNGSDDPPSFDNPLDVSVDLQGFVYVADRGNHRAERYDASGAWVQRVDVELDAFQQALQNPVTLAADDSLVFVGDPTLREVVRYQRRR
ncbi:MAG: hypothetical protein HYR73_06630 [Candidatus Eisenbacteria bacterium]|nr:hypothetical protein [Candidatus Eisenbacteria bacterium]